MSKEAARRCQAASAAFVAAFVGRTVTGATSFLASEASERAGIELSAIEAYQDIIRRAVDTNKDHDSIVLSRLSIVPVEGSYKKCSLKEIVPAPVPSSPMMKCVSGSVRRDTEFAFGCPGCDECAAATKAAADEKTAAEELAILEDFYSNFPVSEKGWL